MRFSLIKNRGQPGSRPILMIICHCLSITDRDLKRAASGTSAESKPNCARLAGSCCGSCKPIVQKLLQNYGPQKPSTGKQES